jgi:hypothetical protein
MLSPKNKGLAPVAARGITPLPMGTTKGKALNFCQVSVIFEHD